MLDLAEIAVRDIIAREKRKKYNISEKGKTVRRRYNKKVKKINSVNRARIRVLQNKKPREWEALVKKFTTPLNQEEVERFSGE